MSKNTEVLRGNNDPSRHRNFCFTDFRSEEPIFDENTMKYLAYAKEICPTTNKEHWQGFVCWKNAQTLKCTIKKLNILTHGKVFIIKGTLKQNIDYCSKQGKLISHGSLPNQGERKDLKEITDEILNGNTKVSDIVENEPMLYHQYGRTLEKAEDIFWSKKWQRDGNFEGIWIHGPAGVGKSHEAFKDYHPDTHYLWTDDNGWWDNYKQQDTVIINDYRGEIPYNKLLKLTDKWPDTVKRRNRQPIPFTSKRIIITSSLPPDKVYKNRDAEDNIEQLHRRFKIIHLKKKPVLTLDSILGGSAATVNV